jgi:hypothetical protein
MTQWICEAGKWGGLVICSLLGILGIVIAVVIACLIASVISKIYFKYESKIHIPDKYYDLAGKIISVIGYAFAILIVLMIIMALGIKIQESICADANAATHSTEVQWQTTAELQAKIDSVMNMSDTIWLEDRHCWELVLTSDTVLFRSDLYQMNYETKWEHGFLFQRQKNPIGDLIPRRFLDYIPLPAPQPDSVWVEGNEMPNLDDLTFHTIKPHWEHIKKQTNHGLLIYETEER